MAWIRLDDQFVDHPKVLDIGPLAECLFVRGLTYASRYLTDGFVPSAHLRRMADLDGMAEARKLVAAGLWEEAEGGFLIHDYLDYQPSAEKVKAERAAARERMQRARGTKQANFANSSDEVPAKFGQCSDNPVPSPAVSPVRPGDDPGDAAAIAAVGAVAPAAAAAAASENNELAQPAGSEAKPARRGAVPCELPALSDTARAVLDEWRRAHGKRSPPKLNPAQAARLETALAELGQERLCEAARWSAEAGVAEFHKTIRAAYTKRQRDEAADGGVDGATGRGPQHGDRARADPDRRGERAAFVAASPFATDRERAGAAG